MKNLILFTFFCFTSSYILAQNNANDWINPNQTYIKLNVSKTGVYRLTSADLTQAGYDLSQVNPDHLHLYYRGVEQNLFLDGEAMGQFRALEFLGKQQDGEEDASLYRDAVSGSRDARLQTHPSYSLFSDTSAYFLTWDSTPSNFRFTAFVDTNYQAYTPVPHFRYTSSLDVDIFPSTTYANGALGPYDPFYTLNSSYGLGEGFVGPGISTTQALNVGIPTEFAANTSTAEIQARIVGRAQSQYQLRIELNNNQNSPILDTTRAQAAPFIQTFTRNINLTQSLPSTSTLDFYSLVHNSAIGNLLEASISYDRLPNLNGESSIQIGQWSSSLNAYFRIAQADGNQVVYAYDIENGVRNKGLIGGGVAHVVVQGGANETELYISTDKGMLQPEIVPNNLRSLSSISGAQLLIITDRSLESSAQAFATYRDTNQVNSLSSQIVFTDEIYDEFGYGSPTPLAIHRFCRYALENWPNRPEYVLLWGKAKDQIRDRTNNLVPAYGFPASDHYFLTPLDASTQSELIPAVPVGRLSISSNQEGLNYLAKVSSYEHNLDITWLNQGVFLGGGTNLGEQRAIQDALNFNQNIFDTSSPQRQSYLCLNTIRPTDTLCTPSIDQGAGLIHYFGHTTANLQDIDIREASEYNNYGKFPLMIGMGSEGGDFTQDSSFGERWVLERNRGAIAFLGNSSFAYLNPLRDLGKILYLNLYVPTDQRLGDAIHTSLVQVQDSLSGIQYINHALQFNLQGDPTLLWRGSQTLTGIDPNQPSIDFKLYPNPAHSQFVVSYNLPKRGRVELRILDVQGRIIDRFQEKMGAGFHEFDWNRPDGISEGIYFVQIIFEGYTYNKKLIIQE